jgi:nicotinamide N-methyltransferase
VIGRWNAALVLASYIDTHKDICSGRQVLELGAGGGLPGLICTLNGATATVLSDYPDAALISNLWHNVSSNIPSDLVQHVDVQGYIWGTPLSPLVEALPEGKRGFDLIIMSDLIFNHSQVFHCFDLY